MDYTILAITIILMGFCWLLLDKQNWLLADKNLKGIGILLFILFIMTASVFMTIAQSVPSGVLFPMNVVSNTLYQNANSVPLYVYGTASGGLQTFIGTNTAQLSFVQSSGSQTLVVPPNYYFIINYSGSYNSFSGEQINMSG